MPEIFRVLFIQQRHVIDSQRATVEQAMQSLGLQVTFASSPEEVAEGALYDVVIAPTVPWLSDVLLKISSLRWVHFLSAGVEKIWAMDYDWSGLILTKSSGVHAAPMSEYAIGAMLYFAKQFDNFGEHSQKSIWQRNWLSELTGRQLVVVGMGSVGVAVAERARAFGMIVSGVARTPRVLAAFKVSGLDALPNMIKDADYVVITLPLTQSTKNLVDDRFFDQLKIGAVFIDMSRGGVVSEDAVVSALDRGVLRGVALDVFEEEPLPRESRLWGRRNALITPHVAGTTPLYLERALKIFEANVAAFRDGQPLLTEVDLVAGY